MTLTPANAAFAQGDGIQADRNAPVNNQPQVLGTGGGIPQVNISAPNKAGLSHNKYTQFDVDQKGAILNNSRQSANTQLGGWIEGNPNLAGGWALSAGGAAGSIPSGGTSLVAMGFGSALVTFSANEAYEGSQRLTGDYNHYIGQAVYDSFMVETYPGQIGYLGNLATDATTTAFLAGVGRAAGRLVSVLDGTANSIWRNFKNGNKTTGTGTTSLGINNTGQPYTPGNQYVNILDERAALHIIKGHIYPGLPNKTIFPREWSQEKILHEIGDIATSPDTRWYIQTGNGGMYTSRGNPARLVAFEVRDGVRIRIIYEPANSRVVTAFPDNVAVPNYRPVR